MKKIVLVIAVISIISFHLFSTSPTIVLGLGLNSLLIPDEEGSLVSDIFMNAGGLFSYRNKITDKSYFSVFSSISGDFIQTDPYVYDDEENISIETGFHLDNSKLVFLTGFNSSITGTDMELPFYCPEWEILYYFITERKKIQPFLSYQGYYFIEPGGEEDIFYEGAEIGIDHRPSITLGYNVSIGAGWEYWPDYPVYTSAGNFSDRIRNDLLCFINGKVEGIHNYFLDWEIMLSVLLRMSNSNDYIKNITYFEERSNDSIAITTEFILEWSPSRFIHIHLNPSITPVYYFYKQAINPDGVLIGEKSWSVSAESSFHIDWTPDNNFYILFDTDGSLNFSNDQDIFTWDVLIHFGIEYSLKL